MQRYTLRKKLQGTKGPVNALVFSNDGVLLLSGGDDECVRVWNIEDFKCEQVLYNPKWGQITTLTWISSEEQIDQRINSICVGTGRGFVGLFPMSNESMWFLWKDAVILGAFAFNDAVEAQAYDPINCRLAVASHSGQVKMFNVDKCASLTPVWTTNISNAIPSSLMFFGGANQSLLIIGTETGEMSCRDAQNSNVLWTKTLIGGIGNAALSPDETTLLVDNLTTGTFDLYRFPASISTSSFPLTSTRRFAKQCVFSEGGKIAICGSDCGRVQVVDVVTGKLLQSLLSEKDSDLFQAVASTTADSVRAMIAGGSSHVANSDIYIWEKQEEVVHMESVPDLGTPIVGIRPGSAWQSIINSFLAFVIVIATYPTWSPFFWNGISSLSIALIRIADCLANLSEANAEKVV